MKDLLYALQMRNNNLHTGLPRNWAEDGVRAPSGSTSHYISPEILFSDKHDDCLFWQDKYSIKTKNKKQDGCV